MSLPFHDSSPRSWISRRDLSWIRTKQIFLERKKSQNHSNRIKNVQMSKSPHSHKSGRKLTFLSSLSPNKVCPRRHGSPFEAPVRAADSPTLYRLPHRTRTDHVGASAARPSAPNGDLWRRWPLKMRPPILRRFRAGSMENSDGAFSRGIGPL